MKNNNIVVNPTIIASSPGHSQLFPVSCITKSWKWPGDEATTSNYTKSRVQQHYDIPEAFSTSNSVTLINGRS